MPARARNRTTAAEFSFSWTNTGKRERDFSRAERSACGRRREPGSGLARQMTRVVASDRTEILYHGEPENLPTFSLTVGEGALDQISIVTRWLAVLITEVNLRGRGVKHERTGHMGKLARRMILRNRPSDMSSARNAFSRPVTCNQEEILGSHPLGRAAGRRSLLKQATTLAGSSILSALAPETGASRANPAG